MPERKVLEVSITSDSICPFCYLGLRKIEKAIDTLKKDDVPIDFKLKFEPFQLDPTLPLDHAVPKRERYERKFGGKERVAQMERNMKANGETYGIKFDYGGELRGTRDSHRLIWKAFELGGEKKQLALVNKLFAGYFEQQRDPAEPNFLAESAEAAGVFSRQDTLDFLKSDEGKKEYEEGIYRAQRMGISGVPFVVFSTPDATKRYAISGAQDPETFVAAFKQAAHL